MGEKTHKKVLDWRKVKHKAQKSSRALRLKLAGRLIREEKIEDFTNIHRRKDPQTGWNQAEIKLNLATFVAKIESE